MKTLLLRRVPAGKTCVLWFWLTTIGVFGSRLLSEMVPSCVNTWSDVTEDVEKSLKKMLPFHRNKNILTVSLKEHWHDQVACSSFPVYHNENNDDVTNAMQHAWEYERSVYSPYKQWIRYGGKIGTPRLFPNLNFEYKRYFPMPYDQLAWHLRNETWKSQSKTQNLALNVSS